jgi:hypothetical protein
MFVSYSQLCVFIPQLDNPFNDWTIWHVEQGFAWRPGSVSFRTLEEVGDYAIEVIVSDEGEATDTAVVRAIQVPFTVPPMGEIAAASISDERRVSVPPGLYELRYEERPGNLVTLTFVRSTAPSFLIRKADRALHPAYPLLTVAEPA